MSDIVLSFRKVYDKLISIISIIFIVFCFYFNAIQIICRCIQVDCVIIWIYENTFKRKAGKYNLMIRNSWLSLFPVLKYIDNYNKPSTDDIASVWLLCYLVRIMCCGFSRKIKLIKLILFNINCPTTYISYYHRCRYTNYASNGSL